MGSALVAKHERAFCGSRPYIRVPAAPCIGLDARDRNTRTKNWLRFALLAAFLCSHLYLYSVAILLGSNTAMSRPEAKPLRRETRTVDQQKMVTCQFCGVSVAEAALQQHNFWNIPCLQQQQEQSGRSARKAKKIARKLYELRQWKLNKVQAEVRKSIAARPGARAMSKPPTTQKRPRRTSP